MLSTFVQVSQVSNLSDARYCAGMGVDMIGFNIDEENPDYVSPQKFQEIKNWLAGVKLLGETKSNDAATIINKINTYGFDAIQVEDKALLLSLSVLNLPIILKTIESDLSNITPQPFAFLMAFDELDEWTKFRLVKESEKVNILLDSNFSAENVKEILQTIPLKGIVLKGSQELRPGYKSYDDLMDILEALEEE